MQIDGTFPWCPTLHYSTVLAFIFAAKPPAPWKDHLCLGSQKQFAFRESL